MSYKIVKTGTAVMYNPGNAANEDVSPGGIEFLKLDIGDYAQPGEDFTITVTPDFPKLVDVNQLYAIWDLFTIPEYPNQRNHHITPFFITSVELESNFKILRCVKAFKSYAVIQNKYIGELL